MLRLQSDMALRITCKVIYTATKGCLFLRSGVITGNW